MNLLIIQLTYIQVRIINFCIIAGLIFAVFAISEYIEQKKEKHAKAEAKACKRYKNRQQQVITDCQMNEVYRAINFKNLMNETQFEYSICKDCTFGQAEECTCTEEKETFIDDLGAVCACNKYNGESIKK